MCLFKTHRLPKISRKPIQCYKIFNVCYGKLYTFYRYVFCQIGGTIKANKMTREEEREQKAMKE